MLRGYIWRSACSAGPLGGLSFSWAGLARADGVSAGALFGAGVFGLVCRFSRQGLSGHWCSRLGRYPGRAVRSGPKGWSSGR
jgi:hypothetical protein